MTSAQLSEWEAYDRLDPIGKWRDEYSIAVLNSLIVNIVSKLYAKKGHTPKEVKPIDFMPNWSGEKREEKKQSVEEMKQVLLSIAAAAKRRTERDKRKRPPVPPPSRLRRIPPPQKI